MKKSDLKTGMRVELRNGYIYIVMLDMREGSRFIRPYGHMNISRYDEELKNDSDRDWDIVKVFSCPMASDEILNIIFAGDLLWERKEIIPAKEMTVEEIQRALGYKIKVVESKGEEL